MSDTIAEGRAAWERLRSRERATWDDWIKVGQALAIGKTEAMKAAGTNRPVGTRYNRAMGKWLADDGLADIVAQERYKILLVLEHRSEIEQSRAGLDDAKRRKLNHPGAIWAHWTRATAGAASSKRGRAAKMNIVNSGKGVGRNGRPVYWPGHIIRRAADAMRESRSTDWLVLARTALEHAVRGADDVTELLARPRASTPRSLRARKLLYSVATYRSI